MKENHQREEEDKVEKKKGKKRLYWDGAREREWNDEIQKEKIKCKIKIKQGK